MEITKTFRWETAEAGSFLGLTELETAPEWDGHTGDDVLKRIKEIL